MVGGGRRLSVRGFRWRHGEVFAGQGKERTRDHFSIYMIVLVLTEIRVGLYDDL